MCNVIIREDMFSKLLIPINGSDNSFRALESAIFLSKKMGAQTTALHIMENLPFGHVQSEKAFNELVSNSNMHYHTTCITILKEQYFQYFEIRMNIALTICAYLG